jgi:hypothetical protein
MGGIMTSKYYKNSVRSWVGTLQKVFLFILTIIFLLVGIYQGVKFLVHQKQSHEYETRTSEYLTSKGYQYEKLTYIEQMMNVGCNYDKTHKLQVTNLISPKGKRLGDMILYFKGPISEWGGYVDNLPKEDDNEERSED